MSAPTADPHHDDHHDDHAHGLSHVAPIKVLAATGGTLLVLTLVTVLATKVDFGANINLAIAMAIAVIKATLVILFFMHLRYDRLFHSVVFAGAILAAALFVGFTLMDSNQYQQTNIWSPDAPPAAPIGPRPTSG
ncbi:MAG TPA: cytochrome C oxidase subunit IV family protein [Kofleriaceae bacterium]|nr:cytochrome C oxidase subunit IV family protein [Kofleriaceae bacterium]HMG52227.1 cytochrome C oxidase subunit IV family protein [Kofleriaceae bacterium]